MPKKYATGIKKKHTTPQNNLAHKAGDSANRRLQKRQ
jgi:hypothetical protein